MKALSLTQPWATAVALELKRWETRSWPTSYRGKLYIQAAKGFPKDCREFAERRAGIPLVQNLPLGMIICECELTDCRKTETLVESLSIEEQAWGDYSPGRYAFHLENVRIIPDPVFHRGALGLWAIAWDEGNQILRQLKAAQSGKERIRA